MSNYGDDWRDTEFGTGQERYYGNLGSGVPEQPTDIRQVDRGGGGGRKGLLIGVAAVVAIALAGGGTYLVTQLGEGDPEPQATSTPTPEETSGPSAAAPTARVSTTSRSASSYEPVVDGWRVNDGGEQYPVIFDVPPESETFTADDGDTDPEWEIDTKKGSYYGYSDPVNGAPLALTSYSAAFRAGHCATSKTSATAFLGFFGSDGGDAPSAASNAYDKFSKAMSLKENGKSRVTYTEGTAKTVKVNDGKTKAVQIRTSIPWSRSDDSFCVRTERELVVTSVPTDNGVGVVVGVRLKDGRTAKGHDVDKKTFDTMIDSIRPRSDS